MKSKFNFWGCTCVVALCLVSVACSSRPDKISKEGTIYIDFDHATPLQASALFDTIEYVPLESSDSFLVSGVSHLKLSEDKDIYFISDKSFYLFDGETGEGKLKIAKLGNGPGEYTSVFDSHLDMNARQIELLDNNGKRVMVYDLDGNYKHAVSLPFMPFMLTKTETSGYWFYNNNLPSDATESKVVHYDAITGKIMEEYDPIDKHLAEYFFVEDEKNLVASDDALFYLSSPVDTIYRITPGKGMEPAYILDLGKYQSPSTFYAANYRDIMEFVEAVKKHDYVFEMPALAVNDRWVVVACIKGGQLYLTFHPTMDGKTTTFSSLLDDFHFATPLPLKNSNMHFCMDDEYFYFTMTAEQLLGLQAGDGQGKGMHELITNKGIADDSNPILVKCKLKKD